MKVAEKGFLPPYFFVSGGIATLSYKVIEQLVHHPLTDIGIDKFLADWKKVPIK